VLIKTWQKPGIAELVKILRWRGVEADPDHTLGVAHRSAHRLTVSSASCRHEMFPYIGFEVGKIWRLGRGVLDAFIPAAQGDGFCGVGLLDKGLGFRRRKDATLFRTSSNLMPTPPVACPMALGGGGGSLAAPRNRQDIGGLSQTLGQDLRAGACLSGGLGRNLAELLLHEGVDLASNLAAGGR
jgi:hypothetical protein